MALTAILLPTPSSPVVVVATFGSVSPSVGLARTSGCWLTGSVARLRSRLLAVALAIDAVVAIVFKMNLGLKESEIVYE